MAVSRDLLSRSLACVAAGSGCAAAGLLSPEIGAWAAAGGVAIAGIGWRRIGRPAAAAALPALALLPAAGWPAWAAWSAASAVAAAAIALWLQGREDAEVLPLRRELRDAERERADLDRQIRRFPLLLDACVALSAARELDQYATVLALRARSLAPEARESLVFLAHNGAAECRAGVAADGRPFTRAPDDDERYVVAEARALIRRSPEAVRVIAPLRSDRRAVGGEGVRGALSVTLVAGGDAGRIAVELLSALARLGGIALAAVELVEQARSLALRDELTGLLGRHEFLRRLDEQLAFARRHGRQLAVVMCDLDHLKRFNDTWGHAAGDAALRAVGRALDGALPRGGLACRFGGEEFAAAAPVDGPDGLCALGEAIRAAVAASVPDPEHTDRRVTTSVGGSLVRANEVARAAIERADRACYASKDAGRDRVTVDP